MTPVAGRLTPAEQAAHYVRLIAAALPLLDRHMLGIPARRVLANVEPSRFRAAHDGVLLKFVGRLRNHGNIINGVSIDPRSRHQWVDTERPSSTPDGDALIELAADLSRVLTGSAPRH